MCCGPCSGGLAGGRERSRALSLSLCRSFLVLLLFPSSTFPPSRLALFSASPAALQRSRQLHGICKDWTPSKVIRLVQTCSHRAFLLTSHAAAAAPSQSPPAPSRKRPTAAGASGRPTLWKSCRRPLKVRCRCGLAVVHLHLTASGLLTTCAGPHKTMSTAATWSLAMSSAKGAK